VGASAQSPPLLSFAAVVPTTPLDFVITNSASGIIDVAWQAPQYDGGSPLLGYYVYYKLTSATTYTQSILVNTTVFSFQIASLTADSEYAVRITADNVKGESTPSGILY
jgi:sulfatase maturation enzyme AslB (radical SAM superfamily)